MSSKKIIKRAFIVVLAIIILCLIIVSLFLYSFYRDQFKGYVNSMNTSAISHYKTINSLTDYKNKLNITEKCDCIIYGESNDYLSYTAYAGEYLKEDVLFYGDSSNEDKSKLYWAIKIVNGDISDVWSSNFPIENEKLHEYTFEEQLDTYKFLTKFSEIEVIGYYKINNETEK